jgi:DNA-binding NtrC family response regulator
MDQNPSAGVRLEVAILAADQAAPAAASDVANAAGTRLTVLVVAAEADARWYVRECLRDHADVRVLEAASVAAALTLDAQAAPQLLIVDAPMSELLVALPLARALVIVDNEPRREQAADARVRFLARPFTADQLVSAVSAATGNRQGTRVAVVTVPP